MKNWINTLKVFFFIFLPINFFAYRVTYYEGCKVVDGELLVKFKRMPQNQEISSFKEKYILDEIHPFVLDKWFIVKFKGDISEKLEQIKKDPLVEHVEPNYILKAFTATPNDEHYSKQKEYLNLIRVPEVWGKYLNSTPTVITVAVLDTGVDTDHPDLNDVIDKEFSGRASDDSPAVIIRRGDYEDDHGHGTHVTGIIAAEWNNNVGIAGIVPKIKVIVLKVLFGPKGEGRTDQIAAGIKYATDNGAKVINLSLGYYRDLQVLKDTIIEAYNKGCVIVAAVGNIERDKPDVPIGQLAYPARYLETIAVGSIDIDNRWSDFSQYGYREDKKSYLDVVAPGRNIYSTFPDKNYKSLLGTSMATPMVSGIAAILLSLYPHLTVEQIRSILKNTADDIDNPGPDIRTGHGRINAYSAILRASEIVPVMVAKTFASPNPLTPQHRVVIFHIPPEIRGSNLKVRIFNFAGETIKDLDSPIWSGEDETGNRVPSGLYFFHISTDKGTATGKFTVIEK